ncbi:Alpha/Beta hydrolase protein [Obelidium mucronatum]|nr:Alpha/Beta hydrolase protein [Obelidium mucronatum]
MGRHFPMINLVDNLVRYSKYATASYGSEFMTVFDVGNIRRLQRVNDPNVPMNHVSFATHVNVPVLDVLYSSTPEPTTLPPPEESIEPVAHYISLDREAGVVVVTLRGTLSLSDLVLDLKFDYAKYKDHLIHAGILHTTQLLNQPASPFFLAVQKALLDNPSFGLVLVGHSLGGGVATLLAYEWSTPNPLSNASAITPFVTSPSSGLPPQRPIHVYSFGTPCIVDYALSTSLKGLATTVINGDDMIPTMSVGLIRDLKTVTFHLLDPVNQGLSEKIISRTLGLQVGSAAGKKPTEEEEDFFFGVISELRSSMKNDRLYPSGSVYWMNHIRSTTKDPTAKDGYTSSSHVVLRRCEDVREICHEPVFSSKMMSDHIPKSYEECVEALHRAMTVARKKSSV